MSLRIQLLIQLPPFIVDILMGDFFPFFGQSSEEKGRRWQKGNAWLGCFQYLWVPTGLHQNATYLGGWGRWVYGCLWIQLAEETFSGEKKLWNHHTFVKGPVSLFHSWTTLAKSFDFLLVWSPHFNNEDNNIISPANPQKNNNKKRLFKILMNIMDMKACVNCSGAMGLVMIFQSSSLWNSCKPEANRLFL